MNGKIKNVVNGELDSFYMESMELWAIITKMFESLTVGMNWLREGRRAVSLFNEQIKVVKASILPGSAAERMKYQKIFALILGHTLREHNINL